MRGTLAGEKLAEQKLAAFEQLQPEFEASFRFVQEVHGQRRFVAFPVAETVHYLHALWICERKDRLLSVYKNIVRYEGQHCLDLLQPLAGGRDRCCGRVPPAQIGCAAFCRYSCARYRKPKPYAMLVMVYCGVSCMVASSYSTAG